MSTKSTFWQAEHRFDLVSYAKDHDGVPTSTYGAAHEWIVECPDCGKAKLSINVKARKWRCFTCDVGGADVLGLVVKLDGKRWGEAIDLILTGSHTSIGQIDQLASALDATPERPASWIPKEIPYPDSFEWVGSATYAGRMGAQYCHARGIGPEVARGMRLGACSSGRQAGRLVFPVYDAAGRLVFYQGRAMWEAAPGEKYAKTLGVKQASEDQAGSGDCLLNLDVIVQHRGLRVLLVEGPVDCAHAWPWGVAVHGKTISGRHVELLMRAGVRELFLGLDPDAIKSTMRIAPVLADLFDVSIVTWPPGKDPGNLTATEIAYYCSRAVRWGTGERLARIEFGLNG